MLGDWYFNRRKTPLLVIAAGPCDLQSDILRKVATFVRGASFSAFERKYWQEPPDHWQWAWHELAVAGDRLDCGSVRDLLAPSLAVIHRVAANMEVPEQVKNLLNPVLNRRGERFTIVATEVPSSGWKDHFGECVAERLETKSRIVDLSTRRKFPPVI